MAVQKLSSKALRWQITGRGEETIASSVPSPSLPLEGVNLVSEVQRCGRKLRKYPSASFASSSTTPGLAEGPLMAILGKFEQRVERMCLVDRPVDYPFLPDSIFSYMAKCMPKLQFIYLRELDLEKINRATVVELANHSTLKK
ncbi:hypothetical protein TELCIR_16272, partial [Teladorsagia circumcincta]